MIANNLVSNGEGKQAAELSGGALISCSIIAYSNLRGKHETWHMLYNISFNSLNFDCNSRCFLATMLSTFILF